MSLQSSGTIKLSELKNEYGDSNPVSLSEFYKGAASGLVQSGTIGPNLSIPSSGSLSLSNFYNGEYLRIIEDPNAYGTATSDQFGGNVPGAVAMDGDLIIVGAYNEDDAGGTTSGKAYIFNTNGDLLHTLNNVYGYSTTQGDAFGYSVAIDATSKLAVVGAPFEDDATGTTAGKVYVFDTDTGSHLFTLDDRNSTGTTQGDWFGSTVAVSGNYILVTARFEDDGATDSGVVHVYNYNVWERTITNPVPAANAAFGSYMAAKDGLVVISNNAETVSGITSAGAAYIYDYTTGIGGTQIARLTERNIPVASNRFGTSVAISSNYVIATNEESSGNTTYRRICVFDRSGTFIRTIDHYPAGNNTTNGQSITSLSTYGDYIISGSGYYDSIDYQNGIAVLSKISDGSLVKLINFPAAGTNSFGARFGWSTSMTSTHIAISAYGEGVDGASTAGITYVFKL